MTARTLEHTRYGRTAVPRRSTLPTSSATHLDIPVTTPASGCRTSAALLPSTLRFWAASAISHRDTPPAPSAHPIPTAEVAE